MLQQGQVVLQEESKPARIASKKMYVMTKRKMCGGMEIAAEGRPEH